MDKGEKMDHRATGEVILGVRKPSLSDFLPKAVSFHKGESPRGAHNN
jgi:hypothetical protein